MVRIPIRNNREQDQQEPDQDFPDSTPEDESLQEAAEQVVSQDALETEAELEPDFEDQYLRLRADFENYKRNVASERARLAEVGKEAVLADILPIFEHMENAIKAAQEHDTNEDMLKGLELVHKELVAVLEKHGVQRIPAQGLEFDPQVHEAAGAIDSDQPQDTVLHEVRPGFTRHGKLLRPALVIVAK